MTTTPASTAATSSSVGDRRNRRGISVFVMVSMAASERLASSMQQETTNAVTAATLSPLALRFTMLPVDESLHLWDVGKYFVKLVHGSGFVISVLRVRSAPSSSWCWVRLRRSPMRRPCTLTGPIRRVQNRGVECGGSALHDQCGGIKGGRWANGAGGVGDISRDGACTGFGKLGCADQVHRGAWLVGYAARRHQRLSDLGNRRWITVHGFIVTHTSSYGINVTVSSHIRISVNRCP